MLQLATIMGEQRSKQRQQRRKAILSLLKFSWMPVQTLMLPLAIGKDYQRPKELQSVAILEFSFCSLRPKRMLMLQEQILTGEQPLREQRNMVAWI
jgi:hypothetical protein